VRKGWRIFGLLVVLWGVPVFGQELSQDVYPSEDELWEALREGVITYEQYEVLRDIIDQGVDSTARYLIDQIPNLLYLMRSDSVFVDSLESDQTAGFVNPRGRKGEPDLIDGRLSYRYLMLMDEEDRSWYRGQADITIAGHWRVDCRFSRERSGKEHLTGRTLGYRSQSGLVRRVEIGTYTTRFGLGLLFGHRGRVLEANSGLDGEAWLSPDYGGYNGAMAELKSGRFSVQTLLSVTRDSTHNIISRGIEVRSTEGKIRPGIVMGGVNVENRKTGRSEDIPMASFLFDHEYTQGTLSAEIGRQFHSGVSSGSLVAEGRHRFETAEMRYAVWNYGDDFADLTSGSKSATMYVTDTLETVALDYRSRRTGQSGAMLRTTVPLNERTTLANSLLHAANLREDNRREFSSDLTCTITDNYTLRLSYLGDWRRETLKDPADRSDHQFRLEGRYDGDRIKTRCYIGWRIDSQTGDRAALFLSGRYRFADGTVYEIWSNFSKIGPDGLEYWYLFGRGLWRLTEELSCGVKVSHSYNRTSTDSHPTQLSLELTADL
jgi:hypothetical protein